MTVLSSSETTCEGRVVNQSGRGMCIAIARAVPAGSMVRIDVEDAMALGEICYCREDPAGEGYLAGVELEHTLTNLSELAELTRAVLGELPRLYKVRTPL
jgi:hypothetical protein